MRDILKWIWRLALVAFILTLFLSDISQLQLFLLMVIIILRIIIVETDRTIY